MENRLLIACGLSLLVFVLWGWLMSIVQPPPEPGAQKGKPSQVVKGPSSKKSETVPELKAQATPEAVEDEPLIPSTSVEDSETEETSPSTDIDAETVTPELPVIPERTVEINNGMITYVLSNRGGVIKSVGSRHMKTEDGEPVELVKHEGTDPYPMTLRSGHGGMDKALAQSVYATDAPPTISLDSSNSKGVVSFHLKHATGLKVDRTYTFEYGNPIFTVETVIDAKPFAKDNFEYTAVWGPGLGGAKETQADYIVFSGPTTFVNNERMETPPADLGEDGVTFSGDLKWTGFQNKYFAAALLPVKGIESAVIKKSGKEDAYVGLVMDSVQSNASSTFRVYIGTKELQVLEDAGDHLVRLIDYGWFGNKFAFLVKPILKALNFFYEMTLNYGWSIILLTFVIKLLFFPLTHKSFKSMKGMQKVQPYVKIIQERHKDDRQKMTQEMMDLYRKHNVSPMGGCLPMLLQIPVFIALYHALFFSIELRGAPFALWITDLSEKDPFFVTPVIMGASMILQQKMTPSTMDPMQQKIMMMMPIVFTFLFITFPSGLVIYWITNNMLTIAQQYYIYKIAKD